MRQDISEHMAPPGTITFAKNVRFSVDGEVRARPGTNALSAATDANVTYATANDGECLLERAPGGFVVGSQGFGYRYDLSKDRLHVGGCYGNAEPLGLFDTMAREDLGVAATLAPYPLSQAAVNGYVATLYSCGNGQGGYGPNDNLAILHIFTEAGVLVTSVRLDNVSAAWIVVDGSTATNFILITQSTANALSARIITTSATGATLGGAAALGTLVANAAYWAACTWPGVGWVLLFQQGAASLEMDAYAGVAVLLTVAAIAVTGTVPVSVYATATHVYVGWSQGAGPSAANARVYDATFSTTSGTVALATDAGVNQFGAPLFGPTSVVGAGGGAAMFAFAFSPSANISETSFTYAGILAVTGAIPIEQTVYQCTPASSPFANGYLWVRAGGIDNNTSNSFHRELLLDFMGLRAADVTGSWEPVIALCCELFIGASQASYNAGWYLQHIAPPVQLSDESWVMGLPRVVREEDKLAVAGAGLAIAEWRHFAIGGARQTATIGEEIMVAGHPTFLHSNAGTRYYDLNANDAVMRDGLDLGFPLPLAVNVALSNGAGTLVTGRYQLRLVIEYIDQSGRRWRSAPSEVIGFDIAGANDTATVTGRANIMWLRVPYAMFTGSQVVMHVYRTTANGSTFYRATPPQGAPRPVSTGVFTFTDGISDALLRVREVLYTDGGVFPNDCPPSCRFISATEDRVWLAGLWETDQLQSSKILVPGEPPQFSDSPAFRVPLPNGVKCTGVAVQDGIVIAFCARAIYAIQGGGPNDQGQGAWDSPRCITRSTGCINHLSIAETSAGIFFESDRGIELLPRGCGEPFFIGEPVFELAGQLGSTGVLSAAVTVNADSTTVRFCIGAVYVLIFDLDTKAWSFDQYPANVMAVCDTDDGAVFALTSISAGFGFLAELANLDRDSIGNGPAEIGSDVVWAAVHPWGISGFGKFSGAIGMLDALSTGYRAQNCTLFLTVDTPNPAEAGKSWLMSQLNQPDYRRRVPQYDAGTAAVLRLTTAGGGWRFMGWTVETEAVGGGRRMAETEQG